MCVRLVPRRDLAVTHKAVAFPASSARQSCGVVSLQPVKHWFQEPEVFAVKRTNSGTFRRNGAADDDRSAGRRAAAGRFHAGGRAG